MYRRLLTPPKSSFFLFGMRGVGKSTWANQNFADALRINLLRESEFQEHLADPRVLPRQLSALNRGSWVIIDEIQRLPQLLNEVHLAIEEQGLKFVLLGSSARKLRRAGTNLLGGRAVQCYLSPLLPAELKVDFSLEQVLRYGSLPLVVQSEDKPQRLEAYVQTYLKEEIQAEAIVRNLAGFARFLPVAALLHGQVISVENLARDCGVARTTVQGFIEILEDTLIAARLPAFEGSLRVKEKRHPKLYWLDSGLVRAAKRQFHPPSSEERGSLFEGLIFQILRSYKNLRLLDYDELYYWSVSASKNVEVDFLLKNKNRYFAIEVKASDRVREEHFAGLKAIAELKSVKRRVLVYLGERSFQHESGVEVWTMERFLEELEAGMGM